jgi:hypothetical protein
MIGRVTELRGSDGSRITIVYGVVTVVPKVIEVRRVWKVLWDGEGIAVLRVGPVVVINVIRKAVVIEAILPWVRGAPGGSGEGEAGMIVGGVGCRDGIGIWVVTDSLCVGGDW